MTNREEWPPRGAAVIGASSFFRQNVSLIRIWKRSHSGIVLLLEKLSCRLPRVMRVIMTRPGWRAGGKHEERGCDEGFHLELEIITSVGIQEVISRTVSPLKQEWGILCCLLSPSGFCCHVPQIFHSLLQEWPGCVNHCLFYCGNHHQEQSS